MVWSEKGYRDATVCEFMRKADATHVFLEIVMGSSDLMICMKCISLLTVSIKHLAPTRPSSGKAGDGSKRIDWSLGRFEILTCTEVIDLGSMVIV